jgi:hypothetical protein
VVHRILLDGLFKNFKNFSSFQDRVNVGNSSEILSGKYSTSQFIALNLNLFVHTSIEKGFQSGWHLNTFNFSFTHFR